MQKYWLARRAAEKFNDILASTVISDFQSRKLEDASFMQTTEDSTATKHRNRTKMLFVKTRN